MGSSDPQYSDSNVKCALTVVHVLWLNTNCRPQREICHASMAVLWVNVIAISALWAVHSIGRCMWLSWFIM